MRMPRVRFTVRRMMVAVAVVAVLTTMVTPEVNRRWNACRAAAYRQAQLAQMHTAFANMSVGLATRSKAAAAQAALSREKVALHREMSRRNWWAFFNPFHECILDEDVY
jgi:type II secretory pathway component PulJ